MASHLDSINDWEALAPEAHYRASSLALKCRISKRQLARYFGARFGVSPQLWIDDLRMRHAFALLASGTALKFVAAELCYKQYSHFCAQFRRIYGINPQAYLVLIRTSGF